MGRFFLFCKCKLTKISNTLLANTSHFHLIEDSFIFYINTMWKVLWIIRVIAGLLLLKAGFGKFGADADKMEFIGSAASNLLPFLDVLPTSVWFWVAAIGQVLAGAALVLWYKTKLAGILWALIMLFAWNHTGWGMDIELLTILIWSLIAAFLWGGDFSLSGMLKGGLGKAGAMAGWVAGGLWDVAKGAGNLAGDVVWWAADLAGKAASTATGAAWSVVGGVADTAGKVAGWAADAAKGTGGLIWGLAGWLWDVTESVINKWGDLAKNAVTQVANKVDAATGWVASDMIDKVEDMAGDMIEKAEDMVEEVIDVD